MILFCVSADGRRAAQLLLLHFCEQVAERGVPGNVGRDHQQPVTKIQGGERQASPLPPEMTVPHNRHDALKSHHITSPHRTPTSRRATVIGLRIHGVECLSLGAGMKLCLVSYGSEAGRLEMFCVETKQRAQRFSLSKLRCSV